jgi:hypothetical protein
MRFISFVLGKGFSVVRTDRCFEPCRVPALKGRADCEATPLQVSKAILELALGNGPKDGGTLSPPSGAVNAKFPRFARPRRHGSSLPPRPVARILDRAGRGP